MILNNLKQANYYLVLTFIMNLHTKVKLKVAFNKKQRIISIN